MLWALPLYIQVHAEAADKRYLIAPLIAKQHKRLHALNDAHQVL